MFQFMQSKCWSSRVSNRSRWTAYVFLMSDRMLVPWITLAWSLYTSHRSATTSNLLKIKTTKSNCACSKIYLNQIRFGFYLILSIGQLTLRQKNRSMFYLCVLPIRSARSRLWKDSILRRKHWIEQLRAESKTPVFKTKSTTITPSDHPNIAIAIANPQIIPPIFSRLLPQVRFAPLPTVESCSPPSRPTRWGYRISDMVVGLSGFTIGQVVWSPHWTKKTQKAQLASISNLMCVSTVYPHTVPRKFCQNSLKANTQTKET